MKQRIDHLKNFGFESETEVVAPGINAKMDEVRAAYGLVGLKHIDESIEARRRIAERYRRELAGIDGITMFDQRPDVKYNYSYFPIFVDAARFGAHARRALRTDEGRRRAVTPVLLSPYQHLFTLQHL